VFMLEIREISQIQKQQSQISSTLGGPKSQLSRAPTADEFYKRDIKKESEDELLQFLCFIADDEEYALELDEIKEVIKVR